MQILQLLESYFNTLGRLIEDTSFKIKENTVGIWR